MTARPSTVARLYELLPRVYRARDDSGQLRQLIEVIAAEIEVLEESLDQFYDDLFIETSADWAVPYIGDLIGYRPLRGGPSTVATPRAEVANTIAYRRRKGTAAMLEQLAFDVTGWKARAVEFFERLATTQYMNHPRPGKGGTPDLRHPAQLEWIGTAFDDYAHLAEARRISTGGGRYNIHNVGIFLWRVEAIELTRSPLVADLGSTQRFRFHPLGIDEPLFGRPRTEDEITHIAERFDVPLPLSRRWLASNFNAYYGKDRSLVVGLLGAATPGEVHICDLSDDGADWAHKPKPGSGAVAIDPVLGRVYFSEAVKLPATAIATFHYGAALQIGGGGYDREPSVAPGGLKHVPADGTLQNLLGDVVAGGVVEIGDNGRYPGNISISANPGKTVVLRAADRCRPVLLPASAIALTPGKDATVILDGLLISGAVKLDASADVEPRKVILRDCTLVPGLSRTKTNEPTNPSAVSLTVSHAFAEVVIERCILGSIQAVEGSSVSLRDSVVDGGIKAGGLKLDECTIIGKVDAVRVDISNSILLAKVTALRRQEGCVRFSRVPDDSVTPPKYHCTAERPAFTSLRYGDPGFAQLRASNVDTIRRGADNESEMGAGNYLFAPQREANLRLRLDEYLRFGLEAGIFYAT